jgi:RNA polymerase sigma factor (sigma-70 family)
MPCASENALIGYADATLSNIERRGIDAHLEACAACRFVVTELVKTDSDASARTTPHPFVDTEVDASLSATQHAGAPSAPRADPLKSARFGRYVIVDLLGAGGMGEVYSAYDPELDRKVAIKVLHPALAADSDARARLLREAQAMAKLSHPNVIQVFDVGAMGDEVFVTMEYVKGGTLRTWLAAQKRSPDEILATFTRAGRGLAAAHAAGLVHRDFKPDNVLVGDDGRIRITDFGLARAMTDVALAAHSTPELGDRPAKLALMRHRYAGPFRAAFEDALRGLAPEDRAVFRMYLVDGLNIEQIGRVQRVHRATVARWIQRAREELFEESRRLLRERLRVNTAEFQSLVRLCRSHLDVSIRGILGRDSSSE